MSLLESCDFGLGEEGLRFYNCSNKERVNVKTPAGIKKALKSGLVPSVSTILSAIRSPYLESWLMRQGMDYFIETGDYEGAFGFGEGESAAFGTQCHELLERQYGPGEVRLGEEDWQNYDIFPHLHAIEPVIHWFNENVEEVILSEKFFADGKLGYGGTTDMLVRLKSKGIYKHDGLYMLDFKCKKQWKTVPLKPTMSYKYQLAAYRKHFEKEYGIMGTMNLLFASPFGSKPEPELAVFDYGLVDYFDGFLSAQKLWLGEQGLGYPEV